MNKYDLAVLKIPSKFELQRVARLVNCAPINSVRAPTFEEIGHCDRIKVQEIGSTKVTIIEREQKETLVVSLVLRGSSNAQMENIQRALESGVSAYKQILHSNEYLNGAAAIESYLANKIQDLSHRQEGLE